MWNIWQHCPTGPPARPGAVPSSSSAQRPGGRRRHRGGRSRADGVLLLQVQEGGGAGKPPARWTADKMMNREQVVISFSTILNFGNKRNIRSHGMLGVATGYRVRFFGK